MYIYRYVYTMYLCVSVCACVCKGACTSMYALVQQRRHGPPGVGTAAPSLDGGLCTCGCHRPVIVVQYLVHGSILDLKHSYSR